jgi:hypothetical protein
MSVIEENSAAFEQIQPPEASLGSLLNDMS